MKEILFLFGKFKLIYIFLNDTDTFLYSRSSHHVYVKTSHKEVQLAEVGPRFEMRREFSIFSIYPKEKQKRKPNCTFLTNCTFFLEHCTAYEIRQGTIENTSSDIEWVLRPYQRTSSKRNQL